MIKKIFRFILIPLMTFFIISCDINVSDSNQENKTENNSTDTPTEDDNSSANNNKPILLPGMENIPKIINDYDGTCGKQWVYVEFGIWPSLKFNGNQDELKQCPNINAWDNCYTDGNGAYYVEIIANPNNSCTSYEKGKKYYFKFLPIKWRVLSNSNNEKLLFSERILCSYQFYKNLDTRMDSENTIHPNNYENSDVRRFLNDDFLNKAFTIEQIENIKTTFVNNDMSSTFGKGEESKNYYGTNEYVCTNTYDKIFLLSENEITSENFGFPVCSDSSKERQKCATEYAEATGILKEKNKLGHCCYWLRSPTYKNGIEGLFVRDDGGSKPLNFSYVNWSNIGIAPALTVEF